MRFPSINMEIWENYGNYGKYGNIYGKYGNYGKKNSLHRLCHTSLLIMPWYIIT